MRKWTYLVAMLMLAGATTTFTGCIDTDEPAGIEELRGAKAELLRAKVAVEAALAAQKQADAALTLAQAKTEEAKAAYEQARAKQQEEIAKQEALRTELQAARNEAEKARIEAEIAEAAKRKADAENDMAEAAKQHEIAMKNLEASLLAAQQKLVEAEKNLKLAQTQLTPQQQNAVNNLMDRIYGYWVDIKTNNESHWGDNWSVIDPVTGEVIEEHNEYNDKYYEEVGWYKKPGLIDDLKDAEVALFNAQKELRAAMNEKEAGNFVAEAEMKVKAAEYKLNAAEKTAEYVAELSKADPTTTDWEKEVKDLKDKMAAIELDGDKLTIEAEKLHADNKLAWDTVKISEKAFNDAVAAEYDITPYKNETLKDNAAAIKLVQTVKTTFTGTYAYGNKDGEKIAMTASLKDSADYGLINKKAILDKIEAGTEAKGYVEDLKALIEGLEKLEANENQDILDSLEIYAVNHEDSIAKYDSIHKAAVAEWEILVNAKKGTKTEPTALINEFKKAITAYNTKFSEAATAIATKNTKIVAVKNAENEVALTAYNATIDSLVNAKKDELYVEIFGIKYTDTSILGKYEGAWDATEDDEKTKADLDYYLSSLDSTKVQTFLADSVSKAWAKDWATTSDNYKNYIVKPAEGTKETAIKTDINSGKNSKILKAYKEYAAAQDSLGNKLVTALGAKFTAFEKADSAFQADLASEFGQVVEVTKRGASDLKLSSTTYGCLQTAAKKDSVAVLDSLTYLYLKQVANLTVTSDTLHFAAASANSTDISAAEVTDLTKTKIDAATTEIAWTNKSKAAWGDEYPDRMLPVAEDAEKIGGTLEDWVDAKNAKVEAEQSMSALDTVKAWITELKAQQTVLNTEIAAAQTAIQTAYDAYAAKYDAYDALFDEINTKIAENNHLYSSYERVKNTIVGVINAYYDGLDYSFSYLNDNNQQVKVEFVYDEDEDNAANLADFFVKYSLYAEYEVIKAESNLKAAELALADAKEGKYDKVAEKTIEVTYAQAEYDAAKANYDAALAQLNALLASFETAE